MLNDQRATTSREDDQDDHHDEDENPIRDIHALIPPHPQPPHHPPHRETSSSLSMGSAEGALSTEIFSTMSREFNALVLAGSTLANNNGTENDDTNRHNNLGMIGEDENNPWAIVPDNSSALDPIPPYPNRGGSSSSSNNNYAEVSVQIVKKEEVESKISAWQNAKIAKVNNRFKREDAIISGWESEQVEKSSAWMKKVERKLEEKRARALEKMQNDMAKAHRKAEERKASAEAKRGTKVARVFQISSLMRAIGRAPAKRSFF